ncbi:DUF7269 family protein [Natronosalvus caseinilyticus]|uniref:DUF7269 family protein n=1 Tax=Natronosalvus caseinilyticus TaxID=2953747 RepID=UPI0028A73BFF|nr:hypothetical protein [Natronosalvus caseinilyticus]
MKRTLLLLVGAGALLATLLSTTGSLPSAAGAIARDGIVLVAGGVAALLGLGVLHSVAAETDTGPNARIGRADERVESDVERIGADLERALERGSLDEPRDQRVLRVRARNRTRVAVTDAVMTTLMADDHGVDEARERVQSGTWTDDPRAAAYLSGSVSVPAKMQLFDWLAGRREQRQLEAALAELAALREVPIENHLATRSDSGTRRSGASSRSRGRTDP